MKKIACLLFFLGLCFCWQTTAQEPEQKEQIRLQIWSDLDPYPGSFDNSKETEKNPAADDEFHKIYGYAIENSKKIAPYLMAGMLEGFNFEYTPYDKKRRVDELWTFSAIEKLNQKINKLEYKNPIVEDGKLISWVYCNRTAAQIRKFEAWTSIVHPRVKGKGSGKLEDGFEGIREACSNAAKSAVREYWRTLIKNKPKEISGRLLLIRNPRIYIRDGQYFVDLDFFLETDRIVSYSIY